MSSLEKLTELEREAFLYAGLSLPVEADGMDIISSGGEKIGSVEFASELTDYLVELINVALALLAEHRQLKERVEVLEGALRPFSTASKVFQGLTCDTTCRKLDMPDSTPVEISCDAFAWVDEDALRGLTAGNFHDARKALAPITPPNGGE